MGNKYYTPKIEEFHVGFEYEVMNPKRKLWSKEIFYLNKSHIDIIQYVDIQDEFTENPIRVKYLDKEDIVSLGFECLEYNNVIGWTFNKYYIGYYRVVNSRDIKYTIIDKDDMIIFTGSIKNKSELKVLLKQLNIK